MLSLVLKQKPPTASEVNDWPSKVEISKAEDTLHKETHRRQNNNNNNSQQTGKSHKPTHMWTFVCVCVLLNNK